MLLTDSMNKCSNNLANKSEDLVCSLLVMIRIGLMDFENQKNSS